MVPAQRRTRLWQPTVRDLPSHDRMEIRIRQNKPNFSWPVALGACRVTRTKFLTDRAGGLEAERGFRQLVGSRAVPILVATLRARDPRGERNPEGALPVSRFRP